MKIRILINVRIKECANLECANVPMDVHSWGNVPMVAGILSPESAGETGLQVGAALLFLE